MKILFFGASVTAQSGSSSYFHLLNDLFDGENIFIEKLGVGACHFDDAGFYFCPEVVKRMPDWCVLEWNTTGLGRFDEYKLKSILSLLNSACIRTAFLILPRLDTNISCNRRCEDQVYEVAKSTGSPLLDLRNLSQIEAGLRDKVHTNSVGARNYAECIRSWIDSDFGSVTFAPKDWPEYGPVGRIEEEILFHDSSMMLISLNRAGNNIPEIVMDVQVGPNMLNLKIDCGIKVIDYSLVDPWAYYERRMFRRVWKAEKNDEREEFLINIGTSNLKPDYSVTKKPAPTLVGRRRLVINSIYALGHARISYIQKT
jgi:hypothetical protein